MAARIFADDVHAPDLPQILDPERTLLIAHLPRSIPALIELLRPYTTTRAVTFYHSRLTEYFEPIAFVRVRDAEGAVAAVRALDRREREFSWYDWKFSSPRRITVALVEEGRVLPRCVAHRFPSAKEDATAGPARDERPVGTGPWVERPLEPGLEEEERQRRKSKKLRKREKEKEKEKEKETDRVQAESQRGMDLDLEAAKPREDAKRIQRQASKQVGAGKERRNDSERAPWYVGLSNASFRHEMRLRHGTAFDQAGSPPHLSFNRLSQNDTNDRRASLVPDRPSALDGLRSSTPPTAPRAIRRLPSSCTTFERSSSVLSTRFSISPVRRASTDPSLSLLGSSTSQSPTSATTGIQSSFTLSCFNLSQPSFHAPTSRTSPLLPSPLPSPSNSPSSTLSRLPSLHLHHSDIPSSKIKALQQSSLLFAECLPDRPEAETLEQDLLLYEAADGPVVVSSRPGHGVGDAEAGKAGHKRRREDSSSSRVSHQSSASLDFAQVLDEGYQETSESVGKRVRFETDRTASDAHALETWEAWYGEGALG